MTAYPACVAGRRVVVSGSMSSSRSVPIMVPSSFREMPRWWHDHDGRAWLDVLPQLVSEQCRRWDLDLDGQPLHGSNALVVPVRRNGERYALRLAPPGDDVTAEAEALRLWDGRGTVRLIDVDRDARTMLLERLDPDRSLGSLLLTEAVPVIAELIGELAVPVGPQIRSTRAIAAAQADGLESDWLASDGPTARSQLDIAIGVAQQRAAAPTQDRAVDGDLHCEQVLAGERATWLVVDPVLLRGDPEYDFARVLWDRLEELPTDREVMEISNCSCAAPGFPGSGPAGGWCCGRCPTCCGGCSAD